MFGALVGRPTDPGWTEQYTELYDIMLAEQEAGAKRRSGKGFHRRGSYMTIHAGITYAPGNKKAHYLHLTKRESKSLYGDPRKWKIKSDLRKFAESELSCTFPGVQAAEPLLCIRKR